MENSSFGRLIGVLVSPLKTFASIAERPTWLVAFLVVALAPAIPGFLAVPKVDWEEVARTQIENSPFTGDLSRSGPMAWEGSGTAKPLGRGRLRIEGDVIFSRDGARSRLTFMARFAEGELRGCSITTVILRPHDHYLWDGNGQITGTSEALREYRGLEVSLSGVTRLDDLDHLDAVFASLPPPRRTPGDRC